MTGRTAKRLIRGHFTARGYFREPNPRRLEEGHERYKKGYEARLPVQTQEEAEMLIEALETLGILPGKPFAKHSQIVVPIYGLDQVERLEKMCF